MSGGRLWIFELSRSERATWAACFGGRTLEAMDTQIYALVLPALMTVFALNHSEAGVLGSLTTLVAACSTLLAGAAADRFGRLRVLQVAVGVCATSTGLAAFAHSFLYLAAIRAVQGVGYAAELTASAILVNEAVQSRFRGRASAAVQTGYGAGYGLALVLMLVVYAMVPEKTAWRVLFAIGVLPGLYVIVLQRFVSESPLYLAQRRAIPLAQDRSSMWDVFRGENGRNALIIALISVGVYGAAQIMIFWLPTYLRSVYHLNVTKTAGYLVLNIIGSFIGPLVYGPISDRYGRRKVFLLFLGLQILAVPAYLGLTGLLPLTLALGLMVGVLQGGLATGVPPMLSELFPTRIRGRAAGINNAFIRAMTALTPALVGVMTARLGFSVAMISVALACYLLSVIGVLIVRETIGQDLIVEGPLGNAPPDRGAEPAASVQPGLAAGRLHS